VVKLLVNRIPFVGSTRHDWLVSFVNFLPFSRCVMAHAIMFVVFLVLAGAGWFVSLALYRSTLSGPDPAQNPDYRAIAISTVTLVGLTSFLPMPWGYLAALVCWALAVGSLCLPISRAVTFFVYLALTSVVARLATLGVLDGV
jgi:hypothetical protein